MDINELIAIVKKKIEENILIQNIQIEDKSFLHKNHKGNDKNKYHLKVSITSNELKDMGRIESNKLIYKTLDHELKNFIHSIQILIN